VSTPVSRRRGRQLEVGDDRWGPPVCEREGEQGGLGWCWAG
jgi:hypothetical protein